MIFSVGWELMTESIKASPFYGTIAWFGITHITAMFIDNCPGEFRRVVRPYGYSRATRKMNKLLLTIPETMTELFIATPYVYFVKKLRKGKYVRVKNAGPYTRYTEVIGQVKSVFLGRITIHPLMIDGHKPTEDEITDHQRHPYQALDDVTPLSDLEAVAHAL